MDISGVVPVNALCGVLNFRLSIAIQLKIEQMYLRHNNQQSAGAPEVLSMVLTHSFTWGYHCLAVFWC